MVITPKTVPDVRVWTLVVKTILTIVGVGGGVVVVVVGGIVVVGGMVVVGGIVVVGGVYVGGPPPVPATMVNKALT
jgi:hypothetical protein